MANHLQVAEHKEFVGAEQNDPAKAASAQVAALLDVGTQTRQGPHVTGHHYLGYSQEELYDMVHADADVARLHAQGHSFNNLGNDLIEMADDMAKTSGHVSWQGTAAQGAADFTASLTSWHRSTGHGAKFAGIRVWEQSEGLQQARAAMPKPVPGLTSADFVTAIVAGPVITPVGSAAALAARHAQSKANHAEMAAVAQQYDSHLGSTSSMPKFPVPKGFRSTSAPSQPGPTAPPPPGPGTQPNPAPDPGHQPGTPGADTGTQTSSAAPSVAGSGPGLPGDPGMPTGPGMPGGPAGSGSGGAGGFGGMFGAGRGTFDGFGAEQPGGSSGSIGARSAAGAVADEDTGRGMPGLPEGEESMGAGPMAAGRGGRRKDDDEHRRPKYLTEAHPNALFGVDGLVVPPVIGG